MSARLALCLLMLCASFQLMARETHKSSAGDGCQTRSDARSEQHVVSEPGSKPSSNPAKPTKSRDDASSSGSAGSNVGVRPPRWQSFLPGMFR